MKIIYTLQRMKVIPCHCQMGFRSQPYMMTKFLFCPAAIEMSTTLKKHAMPMFLPP